MRGTKPRFILCCIQSFTYMAYRQTQIRATTKGNKTTMTKLPGVKSQAEGLVPVILRQRMFRRRKQILLWNPAEAPAPAQFTAPPGLLPSQSQTCNFLGISLESTVFQGKDLQACATLLAPGLPLSDYNSTQATSQLSLIRREEGVGVSATFEMLT